MNNKKSEWTMNRISVMVGIPLLLVAAYWLLTMKPKPPVPEPKVVEFRIGGQKQDTATKKWNVDLIWETEGAELVTIDPLVGKVEPKGTTTVSLDKTGTFVLTAKNSRGKFESTLEIELPAAAK